MIPRNGCGIGVGTGTTAGTRMMWISVAVIRSPCFAAGCPISIQIDHGSFDIDLSSGLNCEIPLCFKENLAARGIKHDLAPIFICERYAAFPVAVVKHNRVSRTGSYDALLDAARF